MIKQLSSIIKYKPVYRLKIVRAILQLTLFLYKIFSCECHMCLLALVLANCGS